MGFLLHATAEGGRTFSDFLSEVILHGFLDTLKVIPFLFLTYLVMEFIEHKASDKTRALMEKAGSLGPVAGGLLGAVPQCGFSAMAANFYTGRVITAGTMLAVFLSTSDEMLPIMLSGSVRPAAILAILGYKILIGIIAGFILDFALKLSKREREHINIDEICDNDNCHCERGIFLSALHHTLTVGGFVLIATLAISTLVFFIGEENLASIMYDKPVISHLIAAAFGLIPNCAASVLLTNLCVGRLITAGTMISGLFSGAGVGLLVLFKVNKRQKENLLFVVLLLIIGTIFGLFADFIDIGALI